MRRACTAARTPTVSARMKTMKPAGMPAKGAGAQDRGDGEAGADGGARLRSAGGWWGRRSGRSSTAGIATRGKTKHISDCGDPRR